MKLNKKDWMFLVILFLIMFISGIEYSMILQIKEEPPMKVEIENLEIKVEQVSALKEVVKPKYNLTEEEVILLSKCVQAEAGVDNFKSQRYVAQVILNRVTSDVFPDTLEEVIYQCEHGVPQFSVAYNGALENVKLRDKTLQNVKKVVKKGTDLPKYVHYFYSSLVSENWVNTLPIYTEVEGTVFAFQKR